MQVLQQNILFNKLQQNKETGVAPVKGQSSCYYFFCILAMNVSDKKNQLGYHRLDLPIIKTSSVLCVACQKQQERKRYSGPELLYSELIRRTRKPPRR